MEREFKVRHAREYCSCNACYARNYASTLTPQIGRQVDTLYEVHIGQFVSVLCGDCLAVLGHEVMEALHEDARPPP